jgi:hypothetical protein
MQAWPKYADRRIAVYQREHGTCVAPEWWYARTPRLAVRMWLAHRIRRFARYLGTAR